MGAGILIGNSINRSKTLSISITATITSGLIVYRKGMRGSYYVMDYSDDGGATWTLNLLMLNPDEDSILMDIDDGVADYRHEIRGTAYKIDYALTPTAFAGIENTDWENIYST